MISNPSYGWCDFKLGTFEIGIFEATPSYLTNVPMDLLNCFIEYYRIGCSCTFFDCEGSEFILVLNNYNTYIIFEDECANSTLYLSYKRIKDLAKELIEDIKSNIEKWSLWECNNCKADLENKIMELEGMLK